MNRHEFAHSLRHSFDGDQNHFNWDVTRFRYARNHEYCDSAKLAETHENQEGFAFNEGWAEYWEGWTWGCAKCSSGVCDASDLETEGNIAWALNQISQCPAAGKGGMLEVLRGAPGSIHSYEQFFDAFQAKFGGSGCSCADHEFPGCGPSSYHQGLTSPAPTKAANFASNYGVQVKAVRAQIAEIDALSKKLKIDLTESRRALSKRPKCDERDHCFSAFQTYIRPHMIQDRLQVLALTKQRLQVSASARYAQSLKARLDEGSLNTWLKSERDQYDREILQLHHRALAAALTSVAELARTSSGAALLAEDLQKKIAKLQDTGVQTGLPPNLLPEGWFGERVQPHL